MEMRTATIHARIKPSLKDRAEKIFVASGHTTSDVLEQFYIQTIRRGKVPIRLAKRRATIPDENLLSSSEIREILRNAHNSANKQISSGNYITTETVKKDLKRKYDLKI